MAGNDVYLYSVPSDVDQDDVRLRDPTTLAGAGISGTAAQPIVVTQAAAGAVAIKGVAAQSVVISQAAAGTVAVKGTAAQSIIVSQVAAGAVAIHGVESVNVLIGQAAEGIVSAVVVEGPAPSGVPVASGGNWRDKKLPPPPRHLVDLVFANEPRQPVEVEASPPAPAPKPRAVVELSPAQRQALTSALAGQEAKAENTANDDEEAMMLILALAA
jgi:hypothetical protein